MGSDASPWLVVVDLQHAFADRDSPWFAPSLKDATKSIARLVPHFESRVIFTRFVPPHEIGGSWSNYYEKWDFAVGTRDSELWSVIEPWRDRKSISSHTFSKWVPDLCDLVGDHPTIVLCGVSTDCCVLATAFAAVDAGAYVRVVENACAAQSPGIHQKALNIMRRRAPQLTIVTTEDEVADPHRDDVGGK